MEFGLLVFDLEIYLTKINHQLQFRTDVLVGERVPDFLTTISKVTSFFESRANKIALEFLQCFEDTIPSELKTREVLKFKPTS